MQAPRVRFTARQMMIATAVVALVAFGAVVSIRWLEREPGDRSVGTGSQGPIAATSSVSTAPLEADLDEITASSPNAAPIEEISLTRHPGLAYPAQFQEIVIRRDGTVTRHEFGTWDEKYRDETLRGSIGSDAFLSLVELLHRRRFFGMEKLGYPMDGPCIELKASDGTAVARVIGQQWNDRAGSPPGFNEIVATIDQSVARITGWNPVK